ncbi:CDP-glycerol glycerophosphotransferase family protein [Citrobacter portucalensis]|uniref:CDP-glycerol glycerophosphotransferase family protein n=1 Tax=Citrobacter portucalensis TaxID=1639133 RepID=UPI0023B02828|nr:CDP-glycerol glycerophosphotransferase family protein [Citrobacter portucalensis]
MKISSVVNVINAFTPKFKQKSIFIGYPDYDDMLRGIIPEIQGDLIVLVEDVEQPKWASGLNVVKKKSVLGLYHLVTSKTIYFTHGVIEGFELLDIQRQRVINLFHGMPLKSIGFMDNKDSVPKSHKVIASSEFFRPIMAKSFGLDLKDVVVTGLPRNEILQTTSNNNKLNFLKEYGDKVVIWLPTYRKSNNGDIREEGNSDIYKDIDFDIINEHFEKNNALLIVKPHPMDVNSFDLNEYKNIIKIDEEWLKNKDATLYELLSLTHSLWTDYSSVFIDYALKGKNIVFLQFDKESYNNDRSFTFDISRDNIPGILIDRKHAFYELLNANFNDIFKGVSNLPNYIERIRYDHSLFFDN